MFEGPFSFGASHMTTFLSVLCCLFIVGKFRACFKREHVFSENKDVHNTCPLLLLTPLLAWIFYLNREGFTLLHMIILYNITCPNVKVTRWINYNLKSVLFPCSHSIVTFDCKHKITSVCNIFIICFIIIITCVSYLSRLS